MATREKTIQSKSEKKAINQIIAELSEAHPLLGYCFEQSRELVDKLLNDEVNPDNGRTTFRVLELWMKLAQTASVIAGRKAKLLEYTGDH